MSRLFSVLLALLAFAVALVRADPPFISGGDSAFVPGISAVQIGGDLYEPASITTAGGSSASSSAAATTTPRIVRGGSRAAKAGGRKMLDGEQNQQNQGQQQIPQVPTDANGNEDGYLMIQGAPYVKVSGR